MDSPDIDILIKDAPWRASSLKGAHEYVMQEKYPQIYAPITALITEEGYDEKFGGWTYRYWNYEGYRYWIVDTFNGIPSGNAAINRAKEDAPRL
ncbi:hypothetical protein M1N90_00875 [Dehalococcoidia bacterium]|nr:hypothetical protein [Dehalococcoidia bacterium]